MQKEEYSQIQDTHSFDEENENTASISQDQPEGKRVCGCVVLREGYALPQFLTMFLISFSSFYAMITAVLLLVLLITSPQYYNLEKSESGKAVSSIILAT